MVNDQSEDYFAGHKDGYDDGYIEGFNDALLKSANELKYSSLLMIWDKDYAWENIRKIEKAIIGFWKR
ncbi:hypothetical protein PBI_PEREGRIN_28 [Rhodococcus phage Peregrin]|nr:hypothetical protein PBI_PEREGRIN_28 [Rhodococcus phage Peregrin]